MPNEVVIGLIAVGGVILGAAMTAWASAYAARNKLREIEMGQLRDRRETYLGNARQHVAAVYIPLQASITKLVLAYDEYRSGVDFDTEDVAPEAERAFRPAIESFLSDTGRLFQSGADAFLTTELTELLLSFSAFLRKSPNAPEAREKVLLSYRAAIPFMGSTEVSRTTEWLSKTRKKVFTSEVSVGVLGFGMTLRREELIEAPPPSREFEERFVNDTVLLRALVKEVTLGSRELPR